MHQSLFGVGHGFTASGAAISESFLMFLLPVVIVAFALAAAWAMVRSSDTTHFAPAASSACDTAIECVRERLARGEITPDEYARIAELLKT